MCYAEQFIFRNFRLFLHCCKLHVQPWLFGMQLATVCMSAYGPVYSVCTHQPKAIWEWNAVHCEPVVAHSSRAVQTICGICAIVHDRRKASEIRLSPANQACTSCFEKTTGVCCIQGNTFLYVLRETVRFSQFQVVPTLL